MLFRGLAFALAVACLLAGSGQRRAFSRQAPQEKDRAADQADDESNQENPVIVIKTSFGDIAVELNPKEAPLTVENFLEYVDDEHYNGTIFHRIIADFMIQGGGMDKNGLEKKTRAPVKNEADNGLKNERGTIAMARTSVVDSATAQFFVNVKDNDFLDHKDKSTRGYGYCVFGKVTEGMDIVDKIKAVKTDGNDKPLKPVEILSITRQEKSSEKKQESK